LKNFAKNRNFLQNSLASCSKRGILTYVPLTDDFGDWATPKKPLAGHFFAHSMTDPRGFGSKVKPTGVRLLMPFARRSGCGDATWAELASATLG
jgi:hypothetical protein